ncbi:TetR/AcrR family transcriptional regulator [Levilactobacillus brevis]|uniref:TetR/AcrR family transcriptional regulator n=1 Tax=Levilactobacillus brevis TaxID=1580 RepID=UPI000BE9752D|nr:TetR/AcrR family transcriptional regulator [Levilactobacillus brevis]MCT3583110.1 TetR/AcrR family transcriptional regulator [Levilactobacillus brevis]MCZ2119963.1 TetR/AcrR family transcriptional regulator [Levilactobacillus brevis]MCZ2125451.1 TetR/AcrR family transcriptional regulator [Levilactobacillus brevis]MCZ2209763.1 TetR/AcrR family transcriptional regulator [Levilactobacillus brevis]MCZ2325234.1 TetR/AcrR family transcriptional regulator [Levilactobacillus brevis]
MREKDTAKQTSIIDEVSNIILNEGIAAVSMSKIAKASGISSSTIYVYFTDKEDVLKQVYLAKKEMLATFLLKNIEATTDNPVIFAQQFMRTLYEFGMQHYEALMIIEQFNSSPVRNNLQISQAESYRGFERLFEATSHAPQFVTDSAAVILGFAYAPIVLYVKARKTNQLTAQTISIEQVIDMCMHALLKE